MKIFILGATGATGLQLTGQAVNAGHQVTVYVRNPDKLGELKNKVNVVEGELTDEQKILKALVGQEAILSTLGYKKLKDKSLFVRRTIVAVIKGMEQYHIPKLVYESANIIGGKDSVSKPFLKLVLKTFGLLNPFIDHFETEKVIRQSNVDWTIARPGNLTKGKLRGEYHAAEKLKGLSKISRADVAHFMLDALTNKKWSRKAIEIGY